MMADKLAIDGGPRTVEEGAVKTWPPHDERDRQAIMDVFDSNVFHGNAAPHALEMQEKWQEFCGCKYALVTNSGTSALHMAVAAAGVLPGDEVITSAFSFWASAAAILHHCAIPVFVDIDPVHYTITRTQSRPRSRRAPPRSCPCTSTACPRTSARSARSRRSTT